MNESNESCSRDRDRDQFRSILDELLLKESNLQRESSELTHIKSNIEVVVHLISRQKIIQFKRTF